MSLKTKQRKEKCFSSKSTVDFVADSNRAEEHVEVAHVVDTTIGQMKNLAELVERPDQMVVDTLGMVDRDTVG